MLAHRDVELARRVAGNASAPGGLLTRLARSTDADVRAAVLANPSTPWRTVLALAEQSPERFAATPRGRAVFDAGGVGHGLVPRARTVRALLAPRALRELWEHDVAAHPLPSVRLALVHAYEADREAPRRAAALAARLEDDDARVRAAALRAHEVIEPTSALRLAEDGVEAVRAALAAHASTPVSVLLRLVEDASVEVRAAVAAHPRLPSDRVEVLSHDASSHVRVMAAQNPALPEARAIVLAREPDRFVREAIVRNVRAPREALVSIVERLAYDPYEQYFVIPRLLTHPSAGEEIAAIFADLHGARGLRDALSLAPRVPRAWVEHAARSADAALRATAARHENAPADLVEALATDREPFVRAAVAVRARLDDALRARLSRDPIARVRREVARCPHTPAHLIWILADDPEPEVRAQVAVHAATPEAIAAHIHADPAVRAWRRRSEW